MTKPVELLNQWLQDERDAGAPNPQQAVLCTATKGAVPHSRVVAIREINPEGLLFFTQKGTRKVTELSQNPVASMTFWFELLQRQVMIEGTVKALGSAKNQYYWRSYPREAQVRFYSYAPTSAEPIASKQILEEKKKQWDVQYGGVSLPMNEFYCGFRIKPLRMVFYAYRTDELSDVVEYTYVSEGWHKRLLSP
ncbi:pyridoxine/pyridoxamine 5'-phosphate oxidase [Legionella oakridgensis]|nr:pyridoxal 5'-phosphate synthase [Legionella oakridgensis]KTD37046.1 pyridoxamine 5'-phosphate oxidase [Legionella oakridgensis]STY20645.1 pyridoxamine 5'-phosphate oxidase [Legionella longbeachae]